MFTCSTTGNAAAISRRHGTLNIGGNLCKIGNESFHGFKGILDEVSQNEPRHVISNNVAFWQV